MLRSMKMAKHQKSPPQKTPEKLVDYIHSGAYFRDARRWYAHTFIQPFCERSMLMIFTAISALAFLLIIINSFHILPITQKVPLALATEKADTEYLQIKPLTRHKEDAWTAVATYLVRTYIEQRESYSPANYSKENIGLQKQRIRKNSSKDVYQNYESLIDISNPRSPIRLYRDTITRSITFQHMNFSRLDNSGGKVDITFVATTTDTKTKSSESSRWNAEVYFQLPSIDPDTAGGSPLGFLVTRYKVTQAE